MKNRRQHGSSYGDTIAANKKRRQRCSNIADNNDKPRGDEQSRTDRGERGMEEKLVVEDGPCTAGAASASSSFETLSSSLILWVL